MKIKLFEEFHRRWYTGDCFEVCGRFMSIGVSDYRPDIKMKPEPGFLLVHGVAINTQDGKPFMHAWVEMDENFVLDLANGKTNVIPKKQYYEVGKIDPATTIKYKSQEVLKKINTTGEWGPWPEFYKLNPNVDR